MKLGKSRYYFQIGLLVTVLVFLGALTWPKAEAQSESTAVEGYAWSDNIGWIHFDHGKNNPVMINPANGELSGYAWSDNIGWISLNRVDTGAPPSNDPGNGSGSIAKIEGTSVNGWARAVSAVNRNDGWDGWIRFDHGKANPVTVDGFGRVDGYAWGSDVVGWIDMSPGTDGPTTCEINGNCPDGDNPDCDSSVRVCGGGNGGGLSVSCEMPATGSVNTNIPWTARASGGTSPYTDYEWIFSSDSGETLVEGTHYSIARIGDIDAEVTYNVNFNSLGTYKGKVTVTDTAGTEEQSDFCTTPDGGDEIVIEPPTNSEGLFKVDTDSCTGYEDDFYHCVLEIDRDAYTTKTVSNFVKLYNLTEESLTWTLNPTQVLGGDIELSFCTSSDLGSCGTSSTVVGAPGADIYVVAKRMNDLIGQHEYEIEITATSGSVGNDEDLILLYYLETNSNQKGL